MKTENNNVECKQITKKYSNFRVEILAFIKGISKKLRLQTRTYYLACFLVDRIYMHSQESECLKPAITAVSAILLAGIYIFGVIWI